LGDIEDGKGTTGGRGAAKIPSNVIPPSANVAFANAEWPQGAVAMFATPAAFAGDEAPLTAFAMMDGDDPIVKAGPEREQWEAVV
jgi:hypothetical protein